MDDEILVSSSNTTIEEVPSTFPGPPGVIGADEPLIWDPSTRRVGVDPAAGLAKDSSLASILTALGSLATNTSAQQILTALGTLGKDASLASILTVLGTLSKDSTLTSGQQQVQSELQLFRVNFTADAQPSSTDWNYTAEPNTNHIVNRGGNSSGSSYLRISLDPLVEATEVLISSKSRFAMPLRFAAGVSISQRVVGQEIFVGMEADDGNGNIDSSTIPADVALPASITVATVNVLPLNINNHGLHGGDRVNIIGNADSRLNVGPVVATIVDANNITVPASLATGTYTAGGYLRMADPFRGANNASGYLFDTATATNVSAVERRNTRAFRTTLINCATTVATQSNTSPYTDAFNATSLLELLMSVEETRYDTYTADSMAGMTGIQKYSQGLPDESKLYHVVMRARNLAGMTRPVARITAITKSGTTTATVTTDVPHGLTTSDIVQVVGVNDQANFPNTAGTAVLSIVNPTQFTAVVGATTTGTSVGGCVVRVQAGQILAGLAGQAVTSIACLANGILTVTGTAAWSGPLAGEYWQLHGMQNGAGTLDGGYKVLRVTGTTLELEALSATTFAAITNTGGAAFRRTDVRVHFTRVNDFNRVDVDVVGGRGNASDQNNSVPVSVVNAGYAVNQGTGSSANPWHVLEPSGIGVADVASAAITTTATTTAVTPGLIANIGHGAYVVQVAVTAVSGTTPTIDVVVQESIDSGTNWKDVYHFERINANGSYSTPQLRLQEGAQIRYVQTVGGTTPSFTRSILRRYFNLTAPLIRRYFNYVLSTTATGQTATYDVKGCDTVELIVLLGAGGTAWPTYQLEGSEDGTNWYPLGAALAFTAASTIQRVVLSGQQLSFVRARVTVAGVSSTLGYICVKAIGR